MRALLLMLLLGSTGCRERVPDRPVVHVEPVYTQPHTDGYNSGFEAGKAASHRRAPLPAREIVARLAEEADHNQDESRSEPWRQGYVEGYTDGFRQIATGLK